MSSIRIAFGALLLTVVARADDANPFFDVPSVLTDEPADQLTRTDVDGDGFDDLVLVLADGAPRVLLTIAGGGFADELPTNLPAFANTRWHFGDVDGDGRTDAVAATEFVTTVPVYLGDGDGTFTQTASVELAEFRREAVLGDVDGDGIDDLVASYEDTPRLRVVFGARVSPFSTFVDATAPQRAEPALVDDIDGDGHADIVSITDALQVDVIRGLGGGTFAPPISEPFTQVVRVVAGDHDGDGDAELAIVDDAAVRIADVSAGTLTTIADLDTLLGDAVWADVDEDGDDDLFVGDAGGSFSRIALLESQAGAPEPLVEAFRGNGPAGFRAPTPLDVDRDGHVDVVFGVPFQPWLHVARGRGDGAFDDHLAGCLWFDVGDVDEDGRLDVVTIERVPLDGWRVLLHRGAFGRTFEPAEQIEQSLSLELDLCLGDVDGDGHLDIVFTDQPNSVDGRLTVLLGDGTGAFTLGDRVLLDDPRNVQCADLDDDGGAELIVGGEGTRVFTWTPGAGLSLSWTDADTPWTRTPFVADVDGVAPLDLIVTFQGGLFAEVYLGVGALDFAAPIQAPLQVVSAVADVTGDGVADLLGFLPNGGPFSLFAGSGDGTFTFQSTLDLPFSPNNVALGDVDGDGLVDLATFSLARFGVALGVPGGGFAPGVELPQLPVRSSASQLVDIHDDGGPALVLGGLTEMFVIPSASRPWRELGFSTSGSAGFARFEGEGPLLGGSAVGLRATGATPSAPATLVIGFAELAAPFAGGLLVPTPDVLVPGLTTDADGTLELAAPWPAGVPAATTLVFQLWCVDPGAPTGFSSTIAIEATTP